MVPGAVGAIVGLIGTVVSRFTDIWEKRSDAEIQFKLSQLNKDIANLEYLKEKARLESSEKISEIEALSRADEANAKAESAILVSSYEHDKTLAQADKTILGNFIRAVIRPVLTVIYSGAFLYVIFFATNEEIIDRQADMIFAAFIEVSVGITLWWFGMRRKSDK